MRLGRTFPIGVIAPEQGSGFTRYKRGDRQDKNTLLEKRLQSSEPVGHNRGSNWGMLARTVDGLVGLNVSKRPPRLARAGSRNAGPPG